MKKFYLLTKTLLVAVLLCVGANAWGEIDLDDPSTYAVKEYSMTTGSLAKGDEYTKISRISYYVATSPEEWTGKIAIQDASNGSGNGLWIRTGGLEAYGGGRSIILCGLKTGQKVVMTSTATLTLTSVNSSTFTSSITETTCTFDMTSDGDVMVTIGKNEYLKSLKVYSEKVATPTFTIGSYNYEEGGYAVTPSCATEGAALTYTIGGGSAKACTSGVPFYAKGGKLNITASKDGWASSSLAEGDQWTLNAAPSSSSPETLIPFQTSNDNGDKNIEHVYKSVTIDVGSNAIAGIVSGNANALKLRTGNNENTITLNVNPGYTITKVSISAKSNNKKATIDLSSTTVDGGENIMTETTTFPVSTESANEYASGTISAKNNIVFTFDNSAIDGTTDKKNKQIQATIKVWYKTPIENAIDDCKTYDASAAFATYIDGVYAAGSLTTVAEVYAAHTAWQIAQAKASHSTDYSKVILDYAVKTSAANHFWGNLSDGTSAPYDGAPDNYYLTWGPSAEYSVWNGVYGLPAGQYTVTTYTYSSIAGNRNQYIAILDPWHDINTAGEGGSREVINTAGWALTTSTFVLNETDNLAFGFYAENIADRTAGIDNWTLTLTGEQVTVSDAGYATYVSSYDLNFSETSIKAYKVKVNTKGIATLTKVDNVPAGTPVLLYTEGGATEFIPVMTGAAAVTENDLVAGTGAAVATTDGDYTNMILNNVNEQIGFYFAAGKTVATNRAYLHIPTDMLPAANAPMLLVFDNADITGISEVAKTKNAGNETYYNLNGQRMAKPTKGLNIVNGKKVIIK